MLQSGSILPTARSGLRFWVAQRFTAAISAYFEQRL